jgi:hypothetical protein
VEKGTAHTAGENTVRYTARPWYFGTSVYVYGDLEAGIQLGTRVDGASGSQLERWFRHFPTAAGPICPEDVNDVQPTQNGSAQIAPAKVIISAELVTQPMRAEQWNLDVSLQFEAAPNQPKIKCQDNPVRWPARARHSDPPESDVRGLRPKTAR